MAGAWVCVSLFQWPMLRSMLRCPPALLTKTRRGVQLRLRRKAVRAQRHLHVERCAVRRQLPADLVWVELGMGGDGGDRGVGGLQGPATRSAAMPGLLLLRCNAASVGARPHLGVYI